MHGDTLRTNRMLILAALLAAVSMLHYFTPVEILPLHQIYRRLYYLPVLFAAYWFGLRGGIVTAAVTALVYVPHLLIHWSHIPSESTSQYSEIVMFFVVGIVTGMLADGERRQRLQYQRAAEERSQALDRLQESMEQIRRADRLSAVGQLSAGIAHEIRNPLGSISGAVDLLLDDLPADHPSGEFAEIVRKETARLQRLLDEFLTFARPSSPTFGAVPLDRLFDHVRRLLSKQAERSRVRLETAVAADLAAAQADEAQLSQVLVNLVLNAVQAAAPDGWVRLSAGQTAEGGILITVEDDGPGFAEEDTQRLFDPFFTTREEGTGLGLSVAYSIVESHAGTITAWRRPEGGARFEIRLPAWGSGTGPQAAPDV